VLVAVRAVCPVCMASYGGVYVTVRDDVDESMTARVAVPAAAAAGARQTC